MKWKIQLLKIALASFSIVAIFLTFSFGAVVNASELKDVKQLATIESINAVGGGPSAELVVNLTSIATYTSYKSANPLRLVIDLSQAVPDKLISSLLEINKGNFKSVKVSRFDTDAGVLTRLEIELVNDSEAVISANKAGAELRVTFPDLVTAKVETPMIEGSLSTEKSVESSSTLIPEPAKVVVQRVLTSISIKNNTILLATDGPVSEYKAFRLNKPERFVLDLLNVKSGMNSRLLSLNAAGVASARVGLYPDKLRIVFDAVTDSFPEATVTKSESGLLIALDSKTNDENKNTKLVATRIESPADLIPKKDTAQEVKAAAPAAITKENTEKVLLDNKSQTTEKALPKDVGRNSDHGKIAPLHQKSNKAGDYAVVEMIDFQVIDNFSRISIKVNGDIEFDKPVTTPGYVTLIIKKAELPKNLQRSLETKSFVSPILRVTPVSVKNKKHKDTKIRIAMRVNAPFTNRQEGDMIYIDFKHPENLSGDKLISEAVDSKKIVKATVNPEDEVTAEYPAMAEQVNKPSGARGYKGRKVTLEFADAEVRKIFQLLSEVSNKNFVLGDEVTGAISLKLVNVPWDQALDIILDTKGLDKREEGNIILIKGKGRFKSQAEEDLDIKKTQLKNEPLFTEYYPVNYSKSATLKPQIESFLTANTGKVGEDERTNTLIVTAIKADLDKIKTYLSRMDVPERQVMIEARIVEATSTFTQTLGISWGMHYRNGAASFLGINQMDSSFGGLTNPSVTSGQSGVAGMNTGMSFGRLASNVQLDMRLNAAASAGLIKIVSTPKIATLNNKVAKITQGQSIPYQNTTSTAGATTQFVQAVLSLEVEPHINANGTIGMKVKATNNSAGAGNPPPINTKEATTEMLLKDGETTVIGGIYKEDETVSEDGVPYLMDIPFLGRLFKSSETRKIKSELLVFITPRILN
jgi:type IV pilus assembly protein PilQ